MGGLVSESMAFSSLAQWLDWLERLHPKAIDLGLERVSQVWRRMGERLACPVISVAGTNGKGSSVALLESIYRAAGYSTGTYTSPHLLRYNERVRLNGEPATDAQLCAAFAVAEQARGEVSLSYFEFGTLAALHLFAQRGPEVVILEVGLGGRLDAVNIIDADLALISSIDYDHQAWLGDDIDQIAREKAGILRPGRPAVFNGVRPPRGLVEVAQQLGAPLLRRDRDYQWRPAEGHWSWRMGERRRSALPFPALYGRHQLDNAAAVLAAIELLGDRLPVGQEAVRTGLTTVRLAGRFQQIPGPPALILDVAHNPEAAHSLAAMLADQPCAGRTLAVFGIMADKDAAGVAASLLRQVDGWYLAAPAVTRAMPAPSLAKVLESLGAEQARVCANMSQALASARAEAGAMDRILVFGSFFTVAEVIGLV